MASEGTTGESGEAGTDEEGSQADAAIQAIFDIIDRYYKGLKREEEGMGVD